MNNDNTDLLKLLLLTNSSIDSYVESLNDRIDKIMSDGCGFSNFERFRNRVMYGLNKDEPIKYSK